MNLAHSIKTSVVRLFLALSPLVLLLVHGMLYNPIGQLAAQRGVDFSSFIKTPLDPLIPSLPVFVLPYIFIWFFPVVLMGCLYLNLGMRDPAPYLHLSLSLLVLMGIVLYNLDIFSRPS
ncbi:MAG: hypothetical protein D3923_06285 [Candidatus Electrothrix sp. AR3]|nr:hypothetical protein [Candidatus Electrothrix sp. AR3]